MPHKNWVLAALIFQLVDLPAYSADPTHDTGGSANTNDSQDPPPPVPQNSAKDDQTKKELNDYLKYISKLSPTLRDKEIDKLIDDKKADTLLKNLNESVDSVNNDLKDTHTDFTTALKARMDSNAKADNPDLLGTSTPKSSPQVPIPSASATPAVSSKASSANTSSPVPNAPNADFNSDAFRILDPLVIGPLQDLADQRFPNLVKPTIPDPKPEPPKINSSSSTVPLPIRDPAVAGVPSSPATSATALPPTISSSVYLPPVKFSDSPPNPRPILNSDDSFFKSDPPAKTNYNPEPLRELAAWDSPPLGENAKTSDPILEPKYAFSNSAPSLTPVTPSISNDSIDRSVPVVTFKEEAPNVEPIASASNANSTANSPLLTVARGAAVGLDASQVENEESVAPETTGEVTSAPKEKSDDKGTFGMLFNFAVGGD